MSNERGALAGFTDEAFEEIVAVAEAAMAAGEHGGIAVRAAYPLVSWTMAAEACRQAKSEPMNGFWQDALAACEELDRKDRKRAVIQ